MKIKTIIQAGMTALFRLKDFFNAVLEFYKNVFLIGFFENAVHLTQVLVQLEESQLDELRVKGHF